MNEEKTTSENDLILKRLIRNYKSAPTSIILPNIKKNISALSLNLSSDIKSDPYINKINSNKDNSQNISEIKSYQNTINLNPKLFKILNSPIMKPPKNEKKSNKNKLFGKLANDIAIKKMKNYYLEQHNFINDEEDETKYGSLEKLLKNTNKKFYFKQKSFIEKIIKNKKNILIFNNNNNFSDTKNGRKINKKNFSGNNSLKNISQENRKIHLDIKTIKYKNPFNSLNSLIKNKIIYKNILKNYKKNTIEGFENSIISMNTVLKYKIIQEHENTTNPQKIKILPFIHKTANNNLNINNNKDTSLFNKLINSELEKDNLFGFNNINTKFYLLKNYFEYPKKDSPESRAEFSFSQEGKEFILYGGLNSIQKSKIWKFNPEDKTWNQIEINGFKNDNRYGHTGVLRYRNLYIFGGKLIYGKTFGDLEIFNLDNKNWTIPQLDTNKRLDLRRNHIASSIGNQMFIHGGINESGKYLNDSYLLSYKPLKWNIPIINSKIELPPMAYHSCCLVIPEKIRNSSKFNIYKSTDDIKDVNINDNIKERGLYIFGGKIFDGEKVTFNKNLYILRICQNPLEWIIPKLAGKEPSERFGCSMSYYEKGNFIVIHGGKNTSLLNDTFLLDLFFLNWIEVEYFNKIKEIPGRYFHKSIIDGNNLFIFGGTNDENFLGSEMFIIELDSNWKCLKERDEINYIRMIKDKKKNMKKKSNNISKELKNDENKEKLDKKDNVNIRQIKNYDNKIVNDDKIIN